MNSAITVLTNLKKIPENGYSIFCGVCSINENNSFDLNSKLTKKVISFEPKIQINKHYYYCDDRFHVESLIESLENEDSNYGYAIISGEGAWFWNVSSSGNKKLLKKVKDPDLPNKHRKGGQSQKRFSHLCEEARHAYVVSVKEEMTKTFIKNNQTICKGLIMAGPANLKNLVFEILENNLKSTVMGIYDIQYDDYTGLMETLDCSENIIKNAKYTKEKEVIQNFCSLLIKSSKKIAYGVEDVMKAFELKAIETLIISDLFDYEYYTIKKEDEIITKFIQKGKKLDDEKIVRKSLIDYLINEAEVNDVKKIEIVSANTSDGKEFLVAFSGIGAKLFYDIDFQNEFENNCNDENNFGSDIDDDDDLDYFL
jgi:peptide chain release factor subunit 1